MMALLRFRVAATALAVAVATGILVTSPASAAATYRIAFTSNGVYPRNGPSLSYTKIGAALSNGASVTVSCEQSGTKVTNIYGESTTIWERLSNGRWVPNAFLNTGVSGWTPGIPRCSFSRSAAATWALGNYGGNASGVADDQECAWFVSHALWAGGLAMNSTWTDTSPTAVNVVRAQAMVDTIVKYGLGTKSTKITWSDQTAKGARVGDVIAYDWGGDGIVDHVAIVTSLNASGYPYVTQRSPAQKSRYWSWSASEGDWIEFAYPGSAAYLVRITK